MTRQALLQLIRESILRQHIACMNEVRIRLCDILAVRKQIERLAA